MKKIIYIISCFSTFLLLSCSDFLDIDAKGKENSENFMNDEGNAVTVINGIYDILSFTSGPGPDDQWLSHHLDFFFGSIATDDAVKGSTLGDFPELAEVESFRMKTGNTITEAYWIHGFWGVSRCNYAISKLPDATIGEALKNRLLGESYFLRAWHYFYLLQHFGGVPLFEEPLKPSDFGAATRASIHETFEFIIADLEEAIRLLPEKSEYARIDAGRATKGASRTLLARILMYQQGIDAESNRTWEEVYRQTSAVINSGEYALVNNYATLFEYDVRNTSESVFEVQAADGTDEYQPAAVGNYYPLIQGNRVSNPDANQGWGFHNPTQNLVDAFDPTDPRLSCTVYGIGFNDGILYGTQMMYDRNEQGSNYLNRKAALPFKPALQGSANKNILLLRYADVLLMHAEAAYHTGKESEARNALNQVRERARKSTYCKGYVDGDADSYIAPPSTPNIPDVTSSGQALLNDILRERRIELALESYRMWDLIRTGRLVDAVSKVKDTDRIGATGSDEARHEGIAENIKRHSFTGKNGTYVPVLPIPLTEIQSWGLEQNPNY
ncbi:MAG: RagB/SusD family nutrient uptake outer membrane protein [Tannerellaceae bacterium]|nr:RagB/SusD family nutrient uptake outer membrane protein [Tannerellaceae bacterium]